MDDCDPPYLSAAFAQLGPQARNRIRRRCLHREPTGLSLAFWRDGRAWPGRRNESSLPSHPPGTAAKLARQKQHGGVKGAHVGILRLVLVVLVIVLP